MLHLIPYCVVAFIYIAVAVDFWRTAKQTNSEIATPSRQLHNAMIALGLLLHGGLLYRDIFAVGGFHFGLFYAISAILWLNAVVYWLANIKQDIAILQAFVLPPAALFVLLSATSIQDYEPPHHDASWFALHVGVAVLAYSLFTFATTHALLMALAERKLHNKPTRIELPSFPPLMVMERLLFEIITLGFILLTLTIISGMLFSEEIFGKPLQFNHKIIFTIASWLIYGWLLFGRLLYGWRGRTAIRWTLAGFGLLMLAYFGTKLVLQLVFGQAY